MPITVRIPMPQGAATPAPSQRDAMKEARTQYFEERRRLDALVAAAIPGSLRWPQNLPEVMLSFEAGFEAGVRLKSLLL